MVLRMFVFHVGLDIFKMSLAAGACSVADSLLDFGQRTLHPIAGPAEVLGLGLSIHSSPFNPFFLPLKILDLSFQSSILSLSGEPPPRFAIRAGPTRSFSFVLVITGF